MTQPDAIVTMSRGLIERGSKSFAGAAKLFDADTRDYAFMLYAWCRYCDDVIDDQTLGFANADGATEPARKAAQLQELRDKTDEALRGAATEPVFVALQRVAAARSIPPRHAFELLDGFEMDVSGHRYETIDDTLAYCYHVAGVVGVMMAMVMGVRDRDTLNRAADLGIAFQLTNIARDVVTDAGSGRVYLPGRWLDEAGVPRGEVDNSAERPKVHAVVTRLLDTADRYYDSAGEGIGRLPFRCGWAIATAQHVYRAIGQLVRSRGERAWDKRAYVSKPRKMVGSVRGLTKAGLASTLSRGRPARPRDGLWTMPGLGS